MISHIRGTVLEKSTHSVVVEANGLGYELEVPVSTAFDLPDQGVEVSLFTHFVVREDAQLLFGFMKRSDRDVFRTLIKINGVGPKVAVSILSCFDASALALCVETENLSALVKVPGIGKKTAERLLIELRDKLKVQVSASADLVSSAAAPASASLDSKTEAVAAMEALGYKPAEAEKLIKKVYSEDLSVEALIKAALKGLHS